MKEIILTKEQQKDLYIFDGGKIGGFRLDRSKFSVEVSGDILFPRLLKVNIKPKEFVCIVYDGVSYIKIESDGVEIIMGEKPDDEKEIFYFGGGWTKHNNSDFGWGISYEAIKLIINDSKKF